MVAKIIIELTGRQHWWIDLVLSVSCPALSIANDENSLFGDTFIDFVSPALVAFNFD